jgi:hypothetical protein
VSTAECECGDRLQTEEHIFWDCKLQEDQRAKITGILIENSKKKVNYRALKAKRKKVCARRLFFFVFCLFFFYLHSGGWKQGLLDTAAT